MENRIEARLKQVKEKKEKALLQRGCLIWKGQKKLLRRKKRQGQIL